MEPVDPPKGFGAQLVSRAEVARTGQQACRVWRWLHEIDEDDRVNMTKALEMDLSTDEILRFLDQEEVPHPAHWAFNNHRRNRCKCPKDSPGVLPEFRKGNG